MKALEFETALNESGMIAVPEAFKDSLFKKRMKVIVLYEEEEDEWRQLAAEQFLKGYDDEDAIYDTYWSYLMQTYKLGDVVLVAFPYTNAARTKKRPALVIADTQDQDIVVCRITSQSKNTKYDVKIQDWKQAGLILSSTVRLHKVATLEKQLINSLLGKLTTNDLMTVKNAIKAIAGSL